MKTPFFKNLLLPICGTEPVRGLPWLLKSESAVGRLGGESRIILKSPGCTSWGANRINCFARGTDERYGIAREMAPTGAAFREPYILPAKV